MNDKLKERNLRNIREQHASYATYMASSVEQIQSEFYQLGRSEVIHELAGWAVRADGGDGIILSDFLSKLNQLKENK